MWVAIGIAAPAPAALPGVYNGNQTELAAGLKLDANGRFQYALSYGALDERAEGKWAERDGKLLLTTEPAPKAPRFRVVSDTPSPDGKLHVSLDEPELLQGSPLTLQLTVEGMNRPIYADADDESGAVELPAGKTVTAIVPDLPVYDIRFEPYALKPGGHRIVFHFEANDLGIAPFREEPLAIDGDELVLTRHDREIRFRKGEQ